MRKKLWNVNGKHHFILISAEVACIASFLTEMGIIHPLLPSFSLQRYGFPVNQLFDMLLEMRDQYGEILLKKWNQSFRCFFFFSLSLFSVFFISIPWFVIWVRVMMIWLSPYDPWEIHTEGITLIGLCSNVRCILLKSDYVYCTSFVLFCNSILGN